MKNRTDYIDIAKGIAIIIVVYGHAAAQFKGSLFYEEHLSFQCRVIFSFVMPIFFMISGAFQKSRLESPNFSHKNYLNKISRSILLPFYSLSIVYLVINLSLQNIINSPSLEDMTYALLIQQSNGDLLPSGVLWFLFTLFALSFITYISFKIIRINPLILICCAIILKSDLNIYHEYHYFAFDKISDFFIFYLFGYYFSEIVIKRPIYKIKYLSVILLLYISLLVIPSNLNPFISLAHKVISPLGIFGILGSLFVIGVSYNLSTKFEKGIVLKILIYYGGYSMMVYVFHMPTFVIFNKIATIFNIAPNYQKQLILFLPGILLPLVYGKLIAYNKVLYKTLLGRNPK